MPRRSNGGDAHLAVQSDERKRYDIRSRVQDQMLIALLQIPGAFSFGWSKSNGSSRIQRYIKEAKIIQNKVPILFIILSMKICVFVPLLLVKCKSFWVFTKTWHIQLSTNGGSYDKSARYKLTQFNVTCFHSVVLAGALKIKGVFNLVFHLAITKTIVIPSKWINGQTCGQTWNATTSWVIPAYYLRWLQSPTLDGNVSNSASITRRSEKYSTLQLALRIANLDAWSTFVLTNLVRMQASRKTGEHHVT